MSSQIGEGPNHKGPDFGVIDEKFDTITEGGNDRSSKINYTGKRAT